MRFFAAKAGGWAAGEDIVQDIYLRASRQDDSGVVVDDPKAWLFRVGLNLVTDAQRSAARAAARERASILGDDGSAPVAADEPSAEAVVDGRLRLARLLDLVEEMPPRMREAFRLHKIEGLSQAEAARRMGVSIKAVEKHLAAALERLVACMPQDRR